MELGEWAAAEKHFAAALHASASQDKTAESASYLAAIKLVKAQVGCGPKPRSFDKVSMSQQNQQLQPDGVHMRAVYSFDDQNQENGEQCPSISPK